MDTEIRIGYTPDSDDAFYYYALQNSIFQVSGIRFQFETDHIINLNHKASDAELDILAISSVYYPKVSNNYQILSVGSSVGRGYGPVLVSRKYHSLNELEGKRVGVAGLPTTGGFLAKYFLPESQFIEMQFDLIADAVAKDELDAGVMIHEELIYYPQKGLHKIADLGKSWQADTGLPLPVGLNIINRQLPNRLKSMLCDSIRESLCYSLTHRQEALEWAKSFGRGSEANCGEEHIEMFANLDSVMMQDDVRESLRFLYQVLVKQKLSNTIPPLDIIDGNPAVLNQLKHLLETCSSAA